MRWHTRVPVVDPERVTDDLVAALHGARCHQLGGDACQSSPRIFAASSARAWRGWRKARIPLVSQSVLLKGVNDDVETLAALMRGFVENRVKPYYLHHPDLAPGTSHFRLGIEEGLALTRELRARLSGLAMPTYVLDMPGGFGKVPLDSANVEKTAQRPSHPRFRGRLARLSSAVKLSIGLRSGPHASLAKREAHILSDDVPRLLSRLKNALTRGGSVRAAPRPCRSPS